MNEPSCDADAWTTETDISGVNPSEDDLNNLLDEVNEDDHRDWSVEIIGNCEAHEKEEDDE